MMATLRRLFWLGLLGGAGYAGWAMWQRQNGLDTPAAPEWPPIDTSTTSATTSAPAAATTPGPASVTASAPATGAAGFASVAASATSQSADEVAVATEEAPPIASNRSDDPPTGRGWVEPVDGECPEGYPIKANDNSGIFHVPGGRFYGRTVPERCYATAEGAIADGYRAAKA